MYAKSIIAAARAALSERAICPTPDGSTDPTASTDPLTTLIESETQKLAEAKAKVDTGEKAKSEVAQATALVATLTAVKDLSTKTQTIATDQLSKTRDSAIALRCTEAFKAANTAAAQLLCKVNLNEKRMLQEVALKLQEPLDPSKSYADYLEEKMAADVDVVAKTEEAAVRRIEADAASAKIDAKAKAISGIASSVAALFSTAQGLVRIVPSPTNLAQAWWQLHKGGLLLSAVDVATDEEHINDLKSSVADAIAEYTAAKARSIDADKALADAVDAQKRATNDLNAADAQVLTRLTALVKKQTP